MMKLSAASKRCSSKVFLSGITENKQSTWSKKLSNSCSTEAIINMSAQRSYQESQIPSMIEAKSMTYSESTSIMMSDYAYLLYLIPHFIKKTRFDLQLSYSSPTSLDLCLLIRASKARLIAKHVLIEAYVSDSKR